MLRSAELVKKIYKSDSNVECDNLVIISNNIIIINHLIMILDYLLKIIKISLKNILLKLIYSHKTSYQSKLVL